jgi:hypothetical protein
MIGYTKVYKYCRKDEIEKIENYELAKNDPDEVWVIHHRLELTINGEFAHTQDELKRLGMFYHRPYYELIFLRRSEHQILHNSALSDNTLNKHIKSATGHVVSVETREKLRNARLGKEPWNKGKKLNYSTSHPHSEELKAEFRQRFKGRFKGYKWKVINGKRVWITETANQT